MLRLAMRLTKADAASAQAWAVKAISGGTMTSNDHTAAVTHTDGPEGINKNGHGLISNYLFSRSNLFSVEGF
jgi:Na+-transporting NADH:ubiquinone oxidoreductase subunit NqrC